MTYADALWNILRHQVQEKSPLCVECRWVIPYGHLHPSPQGGNGCAVPRDKDCPVAQEVLKMMVEDINVVPVE